VREGDEILTLWISASFDLARYRKFPVNRKKPNPIVVTAESLSPSSGFLEVSVDKCRSLSACRIAPGKRLGHPPLQRYSRFDGGGSPGEEQYSAIQVFAGAHKPQWSAPTSSRLSLGETGGEAWIAPPEIDPFRNVCQREGSLEGSNRIYRERLYSKHKEAQRCRRWTEEIL
jgi:hypothetical protein